MEPDVQNVYYILVINNNIVIKERKTYESFVLELPNQSESANPEWQGP